MSIYNIFPKELWISIVLDLPCKYIHKFYDISIECKDFLDQENLIHRRKLLGFPRTSGHYESHDASLHLSLGSFLNDEDIMINANFNSVLGHSKDEHNIRLVLSTILDALYDDDVDLVAGDIITFRGINDVFLFDGETILNIHNNRNIIRENLNPIKNGTIPKHLNPIQNNVPIKYWEDSLLTGTYFILDINDIREELIKNISYNVDQIMYTWFTLNNIQHAIFRFNETKFRDALLNKNYIYLYIDDRDASHFIFKDKDIIIKNVYQIASI